VRAVVKIGSSSVTGPGGEIDDGAIAKLCGEVAEARRSGHEVVIVSSGAVAAGLPALGWAERPDDVGTLQAVAAVGQPRLVARYQHHLDAAGLVAGQVLLDPYDFGQRSQYLHARDTLERLLALGVVPIANENDTVADDEIRFGDNDRLAALLANLVGAELLLLLTDQPGVYTSDPRLDRRASLIEEISELDAALASVTDRPGSPHGSGGMASKLAAARIASRAGVRVVIAGAGQRGVVPAALAGEPVGTVIHPRRTRLSARRLWIAFALPAAGRLTVDAGARAALEDGGRSLLPAGVRAVEGGFERDEAVEVLDPDGELFAKGLVRYGAAELAAVAGRRTSELPEGAPHEVIHRDDLVVLTR
jgi:glutamate 5-kinase